jgi:hypothetical protein
MRSKKDEIICGNVLRLLNETGMTKADLARKTDMTPQAINSLKINGIGSKSIQLKPVNYRFFIALIIKHLSLYFS